MNEDRRYWGTRDEKDRFKVVIGVGDGPLKHIMYHSPTGMEWGYGGSGPADLALSILVDYFGGRRKLAEQFHQDFKWAFVAGFDDGAWVLYGREINSWLKKEFGSTAQELMDAWDKTGRAPVINPAIPLEEGGEN